MAVQLRLVALEPDTVSLERLFCNQLDCEHAANIFLQLLGNSIATREPLV